MHIKRFYKNDDVQNIIEPKLCATPYELEVKVVLVNYEDEHTRVGSLFSSKHVLPYYDIKNVTKEDEITCVEFIMLTHMRICIVSITRGEDQTMTFLPFKGQNLEPPST